uniref:Uncharacterized protein n=1 Tax=viral metagenome TaxID=1070528 RepID=A0A6C0EPT7_9ZZZZ
MCKGVKPEDESYNIDKSYENIRNYIRDNNIKFNEVNRIIKLSTKISNRIMIEKN